MNSYEMFLTLLQKEIYPSRLIEFEYHDCFDFQEIYQLAQIHHVLPMVYAQVNYHKRKIGINDVCQNSWRTQSINMVLMQERASAIFLDLYQKMMKNGIFALVVKGIILRHLYPHPDYRFSSDEDIWIKKEQARQCENFLISQGYRKESYSSEDTITFTHKESGFSLEVHLTPFSTRGAYQSMNQMFAHCFDDYKKVCIQGIEICTLNDTAHYTYLIAHAYQHFMSCGVGIRQLMDISLFQQQFKQSICFEKVEEILLSYHLYEFYRVIKTLIATYIEGNVHNAFHNDASMQDLLDDIMRGGVFGKSSAARISGSNIIHAQLNGATSFIQKINRCLFVSQDILSQQYPWVNKTKVLLPLAWILRIYYFLSRHQFKYRVLVQSFHVGEERLLLAKKYHFFD